MTLFDGREVWRSEDGFYRFDATAKECALCLFRCANAFSRRL